jgi:uncharacterized protein (TIGR02594 family)
MTWLDIGRKEIGVKEAAGAASNPRVLEYLNCTSYGSQQGDETPWCSAFMNFVMKEAGLSYTKNAAARSWLSWGEAILDPVPGCVVVFWRDSPQSWAGHVALYVGDGPNGTLKVLGGNQSDEVCEAYYAKARVLGFRWPKGIPVPTIDSVAQATVDLEYLRALHGEMLRAVGTLLDVGELIRSWAQDIAPLVKGKS